MVWIEPFDFKTIILTYFLGSTELFIILLAIILSVAAAKFRMSTRNYVVILVLSSLIFSLYIGAAMYIAIIFFVGFMTFKSVARLAA